MCSDGTVYRRIGKYRGIPPAGFQPVIVIINAYILRWILFVILWRFIITGISRQVLVQERYFVTLFALRQN